jgi:phage shock protein A
MLDDERKKAAQLESQAATALKAGDRELATRFMREKMNHDATIATLQQSYDQAVATVDQVKVALRRQEEEVRKKTAEALAMKAQWKQAQIQNSISKALEGLTFENQFEGFGAAQERIREAQSEALARQEMMGTSLQGKMIAMEDKTRDLEAEDELSKLEERLGMRPKATATEQTVQVSAAPGAGAGDPTAEAAAQSEAERQIEELERRLRGG